MSRTPAEPGYSADLATDLRMSPLIPSLLRPSGCHGLFNSQTDLDLVPSSQSAEEEEGTAVPNESVAIKSGNVLKMLFGCDQVSGMWPPNLCIEPIQRAVSVNKACLSLRVLCHRFRSCMPAALAATRSGAALRSRTPHFGCAWALSRARRCTMTCRPHNHGIRSHSRKCSPSHR